MPRKSKPPSKRRKPRQPSDLELKKFAYMYYGSSAEYAAEAQIESLDKFVAWMKKPIEAAKPELRVHIGGKAQK